jgi:hypothetical protein
MLYLDKKEKETYMGDDDSLIDDSEPPSKRGLWSNVVASFIFWAGADARLAYYRAYEGHSPTTSVAGFWPLGHDYIAINARSNSVGCF